MPISEKIIEQVNNLKIDSDFKELLLKILSEEDKGTHKYKEIYEKMVNEYLTKNSGGYEDDQNK